MSNLEVNSTNSFVDILANTTGMIIKLTLLAMLLGHQQGRQVDVDARRIDAARAALDSLASEYAGLPDLIAREERRLDEWRERLSRLEDALAATEQAIAAARERAEHDAAALAALEAAALAARGQGTVEERVARARAESERLLAACGSELRALLALDGRAVDERMRTAEAAIAELERELAGTRRELEERDAALARDEALAAAEHARLRAELARRLARIEVRAPTERAYGQRPIMIECYRDAAGGGRIRLLTSANYRREEGRWVPLREGPAVDDFPAHPDFAWLGRGADPSRFVYLIVRTDAFEVARRARAQFARAGWRVEWDPLERERPLAWGAGGAGRGGETTGAGGRSP